MLVLIEFGASNYPNKNKIVIRLTCTVPDITLNDPNLLYCVTRRSQFSPVDKELEPFQLRGNNVGTGAQAVNQIRVERFTVHVQMQALVTSEEDTYN